MRTPTDAGFAPPAGMSLGTERRTLAVAQLIATVGLTLGTAVAVIVVTAGIARADVGSDVVGNESGVFVMALLLGLGFIALGGFGLLPRGRRPRH